MKKFLILSLLILLAIGLVGCLSSYSEKNPVEPERAKLRKIEIKDKLFISKPDWGIFSRALILIYNPNSNYGLYKNKYSVLLKDKDNNLLAVSETEKKNALSDTIFILPPKETIVAEALFSEAKDVPVNIEFKISEKWKSFELVNIPKIEIKSHSFGEGEYSLFVVGGIKNNSIDSQDIYISIAIHDMRGKFVNGGVGMVRKVEKDKTVPFQVNLVNKERGYKVDIKAFPVNIFELDNRQ
ncbi:MAG: hypothetical protein HY776_05085 [Actinobacteria bacterium]|nr:hypothetical protein [Actinomycetota bacterium]